LRSALSILAFCIVALLIALVTPVMAVVAHRWRMLDEPDGRRVRRRMVSRVGAILAVFFVTAVTCLTLLSSVAVRTDHLGPLFGFFLVTNLLLVVVLLDGLRAITPRTKVIAQVITATIGPLAVIAPPRVVLAVEMLGALILAAAFVYAASVLAYHEWHIAAEVLRTSFGRARQAIRQQIHAVDAAHAIRRAQGIDEVNAILAKYAAILGLHGMKIVRDLHNCSHREPRMQTRAVKSWRLECELHHVGGEDGEYSFNIWCDSSLAMGVDGAERVAKILAPAIEMKLTAAIHKNGEMHIPFRKVSGANHHGVGVPRPKRNAVGG
jgi:hypothetical protein